MMETQFFVKKIAMRIIKLFRQSCPRILVALIFSFIGFLVVYDIKMGSLKIMDFETPIMENSVETIIFQNNTIHYNHDSLLCFSQKNETLIQFCQDFEERLKKNPRTICNCQSNKYSLQNLTMQNFPLVESTCSAEATVFGKNTKVLSYSLFHKENNTKLFRDRYLPGVSGNLAARKKFYADWITRVYLNWDSLIRSHFKEICDLVCSDEHIFFCDVANLPGIGNIAHTNPRTWRFFILGDPTVQKFFSRDIDSRPIQRELDAVGQWMESTYAIHVMRDHPLHASEIMGGMWGADHQKLTHEIGQQIRAGLLDPKWLAKNLSDEELLGELMYKKYRNLILVHDSYNCEKFNDSRPFPRKRGKNLEFVAAPILKPGHKPIVPKKCPLKCRPLYGKDWEYC